MTTNHNTEKPSEAADPDVATDMIVVWLRFAKLLIGCGILIVFFLATPARATTTWPFLAAALALIAAEDVAIELVARWVTRRRGCDDPRSVREVVRAKVALYLWPGAFVLLRAADLPSWQAVLLGALSAVVVELAIDRVSRPRRRRS